MEKTDGDVSIAVPSEVTELGRVETFGGVIAGLVGISHESGLVAVMVGVASAVSQAQL